MANTWRSLTKASIAPFTMTDVDAALFAANLPALPDGLAAGVDLSPWGRVNRLVRASVGRWLLWLQAESPAVGSTEVPI